MSVACTTLQAWYGRGPVYLTDGLTFTLYSFISHSPGGSKIMTAPRGIWRRRARLLFGNKEECVGKKNPITKVQTEPDSIPALLRETLFPRLSFRILMFESTVLAASFNKHSITIFRIYVPYFRYPRQPRKGDNAREIFNLTLLPQELSRFDDGILWSGTSRLVPSHTELAMKANSEVPQHSSTNHHAHAVVSHHSELYTVILFPTGIDTPQFPALTTQDDVMKTWPGQMDITWPELDGYNLARVVLRHY
ncbi:hypothetical protein RRG08_053945 [Elysia crispata]|uniref:Uncharacterized protein n=1 Tax=Elysia crispata TaxID=231223 RepID=A0AAE0ZFG9_9GAST|nr:hypothetical protein RRG08_053945 [Elysia crispata]